MRRSPAQWIGLVAGGAAFLALLLLDTPLQSFGEHGARPARAAAVVACMAIWWLTEALPIHWTALLPLLAFPLLRIFGPGFAVNARASALPYVDPYIFLFAGGMAIGAAMQQHDLHRRIALRIMCAIGAEAFDEFLSGAKDIDAHFREVPLEKNVPVLMALLGVWNANFLGAATHAVLPYSNALRLVPSYLQQLEMESNGKRIDREGRAVDYATAPVLWGMEGTVSQHSFHQLLHQGTQTVPVDFIDIAANEHLTANARAQADALAFGTDDPKLPPHKQYPGNRPSSILFLERLTPRNLGRLIALYEHKVFVQGVVWNINSFDQWGVELGKEMARKLLTRR